MTGLHSASKVTWKGGINGYFQRSREVEEEQAN